MTYPVCQRHSGRHERQVRTDGIRPRWGREREVMSEVVLVTSSAGYIGSHVSKALAKSGFTPACYDTLEKGPPWAVRWGPLERGDIGDAARLEEVFARHKPRPIVHMAATSKSADRC